MEEQTFEMEGFIYVPKREVLIVMPSEELKEKLKLHGVSYVAGLKLVYEPPVPGAKDKFQIKLVDPKNPKPDVGN